MLESFLGNLAATIAGGVILAFLFFLLREKVWPLPKITGRWYFRMYTENTAYKPFQGMTLHYIAMLWREGSRVKGTVEKIYENSSTGEREFLAEDRTRGNVEGYIEKNYLGTDSLFLHVIEQGHHRESTYVHELIVSSSDLISGRFTSTVANQDGKVEWQRKAF